jgi:hypothetical protein
MGSRTVIVPTWVGREAFCELLTSLEDEAAGLGVDEPFDDTALRARVADLKAKLLSAYDEQRSRADTAEAERDAARVSRADLMSWARGVINSATRHGIRVCECEEECEACGLDPHACSETLCAQTCQCSYCFACMLDELDKAVDRAAALKALAERP